MADDENKNEDAENGGRDEQDGLYESLRDRLGKEVLIPVAASAAAAAVTYAAKKAPDLAKSFAGDKLDDASDAGGAKGFAAGAASKAMRGGGNLAERLSRGAGDEAREEADESGVGGGLAGRIIGKVTGSSEGGRGWGKGRRLPILRSIDVAADVATVYETWRNFDEFRTFMHRVESVEEQDDQKVAWHENIWGRRRTWNAEITEEKKNERIAWKLTGGGRGTGVITFHRLAPRLTRVEVVFDWQPQGVVEKLASGFRFHKRAAKADLYRFKAYVQTRGADDESEQQGSEQEDREQEGARSRSSQSERGNGNADREQARERREQHRREREREGAAS